MSSSAVQVGRHLLDGTLYVFLAEALLLPTGLLISAFLTRRLGPEGYGLFLLAITFVGWIEGILPALFSRVAVKFVSEAEDWQPVGTVVLRLYLLTGCGFVVVLWLVAAPLATLLNEPSFANTLRLLALDIPLFSVAQAQRNILVGIEAFRPRALTSAGRWVSRFVLIVLLVELGLSVQGALLGSIGASFVELLIGRWYIRPSPFRPSQFPVRRLWPYAMPLFFSTMSVALFKKLDLLLLKVLDGTAAQTGIYGAAQNFSLLLDVFGFSFAPLLLSTLSRLLAAGDTQLAKETGRNALRLSVGLLPVASFFAGSSPEVVRLAFGPLFLSAAPLSAVLMFAAHALVIITVATAILTAGGKPRWIFLLTGPLVPLALAGHLLVIPRLGPVGAALVTALVAGGGALAAMLVVCLHWRILPPGGTVWRSVLISLGAYAIAILWPTPGAWLFLKLPVTGFCIILAFFLLGEFSREEIALGRAIVRVGVE